MNVLIYVLIGIMGMFFGSFFTLAVYRIPRGEDIIYTRSHCTKCNHKLYFWDLFPVFSYIFLGGKCRYCKEPISKRYILLEILSGFVFVCIAVIMNISIYSTAFEIAKYVYTVLTFSIFCIMLGIGKNINITVILVGILIRAIYFLIFDLMNFRLVFIELAIYLIIELAIYILGIRYLLNDDGKKYILTNMLLMGIYVGYMIFVFGIMQTARVLLLAIIINLILEVFKKKVDHVLLVSTLNILMLILMNVNNILKI